MRRPAASPRCRGSRAYRAPAGQLRERAAGGQRRSRQSRFRRVPAAGASGAESAFDGGAARRADARSREDYQARSSALRTRWRSPTASPDVASIRAWRGGDAAPDRRRGLSRLRRGRLRAPRARGGGEALRAIARSCGERRRMPRLTGLQRARGPIVRAHGGRPRNSTAALAARPSRGGQTWFRFLAYQPGRSPTPRARFDAGEARLTITRSRGGRRRRRDAGRLSSVQVGRRKLP